MESRWGLVRPVCAGRAGGTRRQGRGGPRRSSAMTGSSS